MSLRPVKLPTLLRLAEAKGVCTLQHPFLALWEQWRKRFLQATIKHLIQGTPLPPNEDLLDEFRLGQGALTLDEWFQHYRARQVRLSWSAAVLRKLADLAEDLTQDQGMWRIDAADLDHLAQDVVEEFRQRLQRLTDHVGRTYGQQAVRQALDLVRQELQQQVRKWDEPPLWSSRQSEELRNLAQTLRSYAQPRHTSWKVVSKLYPETAASWWLSEAQRKNAERRLVPQLQEAASKRFTQEALRRKRQIGALLLGQQGQPGLLDQQLAQSLGHEDFFQKLLNHVEALPSAEIHADPTTLCTARSLDTPIPSPGKGTVADLYDETIENAGCSAAELAAQLGGQGLNLAGRRRKPSEWPQVPVSTVAVALQRAVDEYLGSQDLKNTLHIDQPKTAFEFAASITLTHPALQPLVRPLIPSLVEQSGPYADTAPVPNGEPRNFRYLFCCAHDRRHWERLLHARATLVATGVGERTAFAPKHPYAVILAQFAAAVPVGALRSLPSWVRQANHLVHKQRKTFPFEVAPFPEFRILPQRPESYPDSEALFSAALKAHLIKVLPNSSGAADRFVLAAMDRQMETLFALATYVAEWHTQEYLHQRLRRPEILRSLEIAFPHVPELGVSATALAGDHDAHRACMTLANIGVLEAATTEHHFRLRWQGPPGVLPLDLFRQEIGALQGMTRDDFVGQLHSNDNFYNNVFWQVVDALTLERISTNDVPVFLRGFVQSL